MNQTTTVAIIRVAFLALVTTVIPPGFLSAQEFTGSFTLPIETRWGIMTLPPGEYSFKVNVAVSPYLIRVYGKNGTNVTFPIALLEDTGGGQSELILVRYGKQGFVSTLRLPQEHVRFEYRLPQGSREQLLAGGPQLIQRIPIVMSPKAAS